MESDNISLQAEKLFGFYQRCFICGGTNNLQVHHRIFKSEEYVLQKFLEEKLDEYYKRTGKKLINWGLNDIQNLVLLCRDCHEGDSGRGVHGGNQRLRNLLRNSFTCPKTLFNIFFGKSEL